MLCRRVHLLELHLFSFFLLCPFQCWLVNMSKCSELWRLKERFIVTECSQGFWLYWWDLWKISWHFYKNNNIEIKPTTSRQILRQWRQFICYDCTVLWLYRLSYCQCSWSLPIQLCFRPVCHFLFSLLSLHFPVTEFEFKYNFQDKIQESS